jgi:diguanylate cyclase (GGDEF)-like protein
VAVLIFNTAHGLDPHAGQQIWRGWIIGDILQALLVVAPLLYFAGPSVRSWIARQFASPPRYEVTYTRASIIAATTFALIAMLTFVGIFMLQDSLDLDPDVRTRSGELLLPRLQEMQFYLYILVAALTVTTGIFSTVLGRMGERQRSLSRRESLTGCFNRRAFYELFPREVERAHRLSHGVSLVFLDIDHFKRINDRYGHETGDRVLQQLAARLQATVRETDLLFRWGGEEFVILLAHTAPEDAPVLAERIRAAVEARPFLEDEAFRPVRVTVSVGTAGAAEYPIEPDELLARADAACYRAKEAGRNRVEAAAA